MNEIPRIHPPGAPGEDVIDAALEGGPAALPDELRHSLVARSTDRIKVRYGSGYEHFVRADPTPDTGPVVFHWTERTQVAE